MANRTPLQWAALPLPCEVPPPFLASRDHSRRQICRGHENKAPLGTNFLEEIYSVGRAEGEGVACMEMAVVPRERGARLHERVERRQRNRVGSGAAAPSHGMAQSEKWRVTRESRENHTSFI